MLAMTRAWVLACLLGATALAIALRVGSTTTWAIELARYVPYPVYLVPTLIAVVLAWRLGWVWRVAALASTAVVATQIMGLVFGRADSGSGQFRLMTYNVKSYLAAQRADGLAVLAWEIRHHNPDVIVMQDASSIDLVNNSAAALRAALAGLQVYAFGQYLVASRFDLIGCGPGDISIRGEKHTFVSCTLDIQGARVQVLTAHFLTPRGGLNATRREWIQGLDEWQQNFADRMVQSEALAAVVARTPRPLIVAGDLNAPPHSPVVRQLLAVGLRDAFGAAGLGYGYSYGHSLRPGIDLLRIDHILISHDLGVRDAFVGGKDASEHRPVVADLLLRRD
jgi:endonuclease/exonuclease/phosphatase (EEP) superfamily protein YafD